MEFSSSSYIGSESLKGVPVTVLITQGTINRGEKIVINIVATSHSPVSAEGMCISIHIYIMHKHPHTTMSCPTCYVLVFIHIIKHDST